MKNWFFLIVLAGVFLILYLNNKTRAEKKVIGALFITAGIFIISPIPDFTDFVLFPMFSSMLGWDISSMSQIGDYIGLYVLLTGIIGIGLIWIGLRISGYSLKFVWSKIRG